jgi:hypothetical protein
VDIDQLDLLTECTERAAEIARSSVGVELEEVNGHVLFLLASPIPLGFAYSSRLRLRLLAAATTTV